MKTSVIIGIILLLVIVAIVLWSCSKKLSRVLLTKNKVYRWKIYHVTENNYPAGTNMYFEIFLGKHQLILPKEITGGERDISRFHAAGAYGNHETNYDSVLIVYEALAKDERGFDQRKMITIQVTFGGDNKIQLTDICTGQTTML